MDPQQVENTQNTQQQDNLSLLKNKKLLLIIAAIALLFISLTVLVVIFATNNSSQDNETTPTAQEQQYEQERQLLAEFAQPGAIILYGTHSEDGVDIFAFDLQNTQEYFLTTLPNNIKQVSPISDNQLLYLSETDDLDFAQKLSIRNVESGNDSIVYEALNNYKIDGYRLSADNSKVVIWEVAKGPTGTLQGGTSKLTLIRLDNSENYTQLIEQTVTESDPIAYPVLVNDEFVYVDTFLPNSGAGWAYGMSKINLSTQQMQSIPSMQNGTYSSRPIASPNGTEILFAGYDGTQGNGSQTDENGFRTALIFANTIEILDTTTDQRQQLTNLPENNTYFRLKWGENNNNLLYAALDGQGDVVEATYNIAQSRAQQIDSSENIVTAAQLDTTTFLQGEINENAPTTANLASDTIYEYTYANLDVFDPSRNTSVKIPTSTSFIQYIDTIYSPEASVQSDTAFIQQDFLDNIRNIIEFGEKIGSDNNELQLRKFIVPTRPIEREVISEREPEPTSQPSQPDPTDPIGFKPAPNDDPDPTDPPSKPSNSVNCHNIVDPICKSKHPAESYNDPNWPDFQECRREMSKQYMADGKCDWTPLYLYGPSGLNVNISFHTPLFNSNIPTTNGKYNVTLSKNGSFTSEKITYKSISSDFTPTRNINPPTYGKVVKKENIENTVREYASNLGLNERETSELVSSITAQAKTPYTFVSFYSQEVSKYLLPITFEPTPDTYINYVFYIKNLQSPNELGYTPKAPDFPTPNKRGIFTAVEISVISD